MTDSLRAFVKVFVFFLFVVVFEYCNVLNISIVLS